MYYVTLVGGGTYLEQSLAFLEIKRAEMEELKKEFEDAKFEGKGLISSDIFGGIS